MNLTNSKHFLTIHFFSCCQSSIPTVPLSTIWSRPPRSRSSSLNQSPARFEVRDSNVSIAKCPVWKSEVLELVKSPYAAGANTSSHTNICHMKTRKTKVEILRRTTTRGSKNRLENMHILKKKKQTHGIGKKKVLCIFRFSLLIA